MRYQVNAYDAQGRAVHMGTQEFRKVSLSTIRQHEAKWRAWRKVFIAENPGDYPLSVEAKDPSRKVTFVTVQPIVTPPVDPQPFTL